MEKVLKNYFFDTKLILFERGESKILMCHLLNLVNLLKIVEKIQIERTNHISNYFFYDNCMELTL